jgi:hypothetical protein
MPSDDPITVTPLAETAEPVEAQDTAPSPQPEAQAPEAAPPAAEPVEGDSPETSAEPEQPKAAPPKPEKSLREALIDKLTGVEEPKSEDDEEPTPPANPQDKAPAKPEDTPKDKPADPPEDLNELTNETAKAMKPGDVRRKINRLIARVREATPLAAVGKDIIDTCEANGLAPADFKAWVNIGIGLQQGNPQAVEMFKGIAAKVGTAPEATPVMPADFEAKLAELEEAVDISPKAARQLRALFGKPQTEQPNTQPAAPPKPNTQTPNAQTPAAKPQQAVDPRQVGLDAMVKVGERYKAQIGADRWQEIQPALSAALKAKGARAPGAWADVYESEIEKILARAPKPTTPDSNLRPGGQAGSSTPQFKTERARVLHKLTNG